MDISNILSNVTYDDAFTNGIVESLIGKINKSNIVTPAHKLKLSSHFGVGSHMVSTHPIDLIKESILGASEDRIVISFLFGYLTDLNKFDHKLINAGFNCGLDSGDVITLLILNNIDDINEFCIKRRITSDRYYTIATLKKLSALYKLQHNF